MRPISEKNINVNYKFQDIAQEVPSILENKQVPSRPLKGKTVSVLVSREEIIRQGGNEKKGEILVIFSRRDIPIENFKNKSFVKNFQKQQDSTMKKLRDFLDHVGSQKLGAQGKNKYSDVMLSSITKHHSYLSAFEKNDANKITELTKLIVDLSFDLEDNLREEKELNFKMDALNNTIKKDGATDFHIASKNKLLSDIKEKNILANSISKQINKIDEKIKLLKEPYSRISEYADASQFIEMMILKQNSIAVDNPFTSIQDTEAMTEDDVSTDSETVKNGDRKVTDDSLNSPLAMQKDTAAFSQSTRGVTASAKPIPKPLPKPQITSKPLSEITSKQNSASNEKISSAYSPTLSAEANKSTGSSPKSARLIAGSLKPIPSGIKKT